MISLGIHVETLYMLKLISAYLSSLYRSVSESALTSVDFPYKKSIKELGFSKSVESLNIFSIGIFWRNIVIKDILGERTILVHPHTAFVYPTTATVTSS